MTTASARRTPLVPVLTSLALLVVGCSGSDAEPTTAQAGTPTVAEPPTPSPTPAAVATTSAGPITVTDAAGFELTFESPPERIACLDGTCIDVLAELGVTPLAAQNIAMASDPAYFGEDLGIETIAGSFFEPDLEAITALQPDLVMGTNGVHAGLREALEGVAPVYLQRIEDYEDALAHLETTGGILGLEDEATAAADAFLAKLVAYRQAPGDRVPLSMYGSDADFGIDAANSIIGRALAEVTAYPWPDSDDAGGFLQFSLEEVLAVDPDAIFVQTFNFEGDTPPLSEQLADNPLWSELQAVQNGEVYEVDTDWWASGRGTRTLSLILDFVMTRLYPEEFPEPATG